MAGVGWWGPGTFFLLHSKYTARPRPDPAHANQSTNRGSLGQRDKPLSEENLAEFTRFFLGTYLDQVTFMESLMQHPIGCAHAFCYGRRKKPGSTSCRPNRAPSFKRCSIAASFPARMLPPLSAPASVKRVVSSRRLASTAYSFRKVRARARGTGLSRSACRALNAWVVPGEVGLTRPFGLCRKEL